VVEVLHRWLVKGKEGELYPYVRRRYVLMFFFSVVEKDGFLARGRRGGGWGSVSLIDGKTLYSPSSWSSPRFLRCKERRVLSFVEGRKGVKGILDFSEGGEEEGSTLCK